jgi:hypothetical protein
MVKFLLHIIYLLFSENNNEIANFYSPRIRPGIVFIREIRKTGVTFPPQKSACQPFMMVATFSRQLYATYYGGNIPTT